MAYDEYNHFVTIVAGDKPDELIAKYNSNNIEEPYVVYKYSDAKKLKEKYLAYYTALLNISKTKEETLVLKETIENIRKENEHDFFYDITEKYDHDKKTGDAISTKNKNGKYSSCCIGKMFSVPFINNDGIEVFSEKKGNIDWDLIHGHGKEVYEKAWDLVMGGVEPKDDSEKKIYENMKNRTGYFQKFGTKENYVTSCTSFWGYAFLSEETGWVELEENMEQFKWMNEYFDTFIKNLPDNTLLTIYECRRD